MVDKGPGPRSSASSAARNAPDGRVEVFAQGPRERVEELIGLLEEKPSSDCGRRRDELRHDVGSAPGRLVGFVESDR